MIRSAGYDISFVKNPKLNDAMINQLLCSRIEQRLLSASEAGQDTNMSERGQTAKSVTSSKSVQSRRSHVLTREVYMEVTRHC